MLNCGYQSHVHEVLGSVKIFNENGEAHNHRFAGVTGEVIPINNGMNHTHKLVTRTDFYEEHFHNICIFVGKAIPVSKNRHVHYIYAKTELSDGHFHIFIVATLIENPIGD